MNRLSLIVRDAVLSILALVVIYSNGAIVLNHVLYLSFEKEPFPLHAGLYDLFITFPVFTTYEMHNREMILRGEKKDMPGEWVDLDVGDYFPFRRGEQHQRMFARKHTYNYGVKGQQRAWKRVIRKIRERYNRTHPDEPIGRVSMEVATWPRSKEGYWAEKKEGKIEIGNLYTEPERA